MELNDLINQEFSNNDASFKVMLTNKPKGKKQREAIITLNGDESIGSWVLKSSDDESILTLNHGSKGKQRLQFVIKKGETLAEVIENCYLH